MIISSLISVAVGALIAVIGSYVTQDRAARSAERREYSRQEHDSQMRLWEARLTAYREMLRVCSGVNLKDLRVQELLEAYSGAQLVIGKDDELQNRLKALHDAAQASRDRAEALGSRRRALERDKNFRDLQEETRQRRNEFLGAIRNQLGTS